MLKVTGLEGVVAAETLLSHVDGNDGQLVYRGHWAEQLALDRSFEEVAYLLWYGQLPTEQQLTALKRQLQRHRELPVHAGRLLETLPPSMDMMSVVRTVVSGLGDRDCTWPPTVEQAVALTAVLPTIIACRERQLRGEAFIPPRPELDHIANYLYMLHGKEPSDAHVRALNAYFILTAEHGMNASTFAARVIASTQSDINSAIVGAIGAMKGPLHGGAPAGVIAMLEAIGKPERAEAWIREALARGERLMGFGHRIYKTRDPRAEALKKITNELAAADPLFDLAREVEQTAVRLLEEYKPGRKLYTNVEFYAAAVLQAVAMPSTLYTPTFTASRIVGWTAHVLEQAAYNRIFRPQSVYVGSVPSKDI